MYWRFLNTLNQFESIGLAAVFAPRAAAAEPSELHRLHANLTEPPPVTHLLVRLAYYPTRPPGTSSEPRRRRRCCCSSCRTHAASSPREPP